MPPRRTANSHKRAQDEEHPAAPDSKRVDAEPQPLPICVVYDDDGEIRYLYNKTGELTSEMALVWPFLCKQDEDFLMWVFSALGFGDAIATDGERQEGVEAMSDLPEMCMVFLGKLEEQKSLWAEYTREQYLDATENGLKPVRQLYVRLNN